MTCRKCLGIYLLQMNFDSVNLALRAVEKAAKERIGAIVGQSLSVFDDPALLKSLKRAGGDEVLMVKAPPSAIGSHGAHISGLPNHFLSCV